MKIRNTADGQVKDKITSIFFGGGTPSVLPDGCIADILAAVRDCFDVLDDAEITMECNPEQLMKAGFQNTEPQGVNRLSFGLTSADNNELKMLGRIHTFEQFEEKASDWQGLQALIILMLTLCRLFRGRLKQLLKIHLTR